METTMPLTDEDIQEKFLKAIDEAGPEGLKLDNEDIELSLCQELGIEPTAPNAIVVSRAVGILVRRGTLKSELDGKPITLDGSHGKRYKTQQYTIYKRPAA